MTCSVTYLRIGTRSRGGAATQPSRAHSEVNDAKLALVFGTQKPVLRNIGTRIDSGGCIMSAAASTSAPAGNRVDGRRCSRHIRGSRTMANEPRRRRKAPDVETSTPPDLLTDDLRRRDPPQTPARIPLRQTRRVRKKKMLSAEASHREPMVEMISTPSTTRIRRTPPRTITSGKSIV